ncbi:hypothetical protein Micbo1qcDRAFT_206762 [Microdochium bolleyi]|uniref:Uncharacterized protein n=1 Tax=Microdochium bolleyi TaxID=196109 RepID=A0A136IWC5_9PEZI|nr:hypothetical protein Micbo1qcDRAFT_206762 [Microdochium bolleyi]
MDMSPASQPIVLPDGSSAVDAHAGPTASSSPRRSSSSIATPTDSPSQNIARTPLSPGPGVKTLGDGVSSVGGMGYTASIAPAVTPATFLNSDARLYPRDGRVRDPVPSKLKGVPRDLSANFAVMHMDVNSHPKSKGRDAAAKRTSESTALQARLASTPSYVSHHRRANYPKPPGFKPHVVTSSPRLQGHSISSTLPHAPTPTAPALPAPPAPQVLTTDPDLVMLPLSSHEVKSEQARLLTLLRTLPPSTVVDQICKALAFFGGIPEAPPPADGHFPASGEANGQGSLFVGWVSEIFPNLEQPRQPVPRPPPSPPTLQPIVEATSQLVPQSVKRPRGRPKGSKATKVRSDKGIKKGPLKSARKSTTGADTLLSEGQPDVSAVVDGIPPEVDNMTQGSFSAGSAEGPTTINGTPHPPPLVPLQPSTQLPEVSQTPGKKRGRPKGSKNRPKDNSSVGPLAQPQIQVPPTTTVDRSEPLCVATLPFPTLATFAI